MMKELTKRVSAPLISARNSCQSVYNRLDSRSKKAVMFAALLLFQLVIMTRTALTGVGSLAYAAFLPVLLLDGLAWAVRLLSSFSVSRVVHIPTVLLTIGICTQTALSTPNPSRTVHIPSSFLTSAAEVTKCSFPWSSPFFYFIP